MGANWAVRLLLAMAERPARKPSDVELEPIEPGAWAAWARESGPLARPGTHPAPRDTRVAPGRFEVNPAIYPRGSGLRWRL